MPRKSIKVAEVAPETALPVTEVVKTDPPFQLSPEELAIIMQLRSGNVPTAPAVPVSQDSIAIIAQALKQAIEATKPIEKKNSLTRKRNNPWTPKNGELKITQFKHPMYHHGIPIDPNCTKNEWCILLDQIRPGKYCNNKITVTKRKDNGYDIDYPIRTVQQRLEAVAAYGGGDFGNLLRRLIDERKDPKKYIQTDEDE